jgi:alkyl hydroperoxide reductase subunit AhpC
MTDANKVMALSGSCRWKRAAGLAAALCVCLLPVAGAAAAAAAAGAGAAGDTVTGYSTIYVMDPIQIKIGVAVPVFKARGILGKEVDFEALVKSGRPVILAFWSKYCKACVEKFSALVALQAKYEPQGLQVISVNTDGEYKEGEASIRDFLRLIESQRQIQINFPVIYDDHNRIPYALGINFLPTIIAVDAQGRVLDFYQKFDEAGEAEILAGIEALVQKALAASRPAVPAVAPPAKP